MVDLHVTSLGLVGYTAGAGAGLLLCIYLLRRWRGRLDHILLFVAAVVSTLWSSWVAYQISEGAALSSVFYVLEASRDALWLVFLLQMISVIFGGKKTTDILLRLAIALGLSTLALVSFAVLLFPPTVILGTPFGSGMALLLGGLVLLALAGFVAVVQLFRSASNEQRGSVKLLCLALGGIFLYDFFMYVDALLAGRISLDFWQARGPVNALSLSLIALSIRNPLWSRAIYISHTAVFYSLVAVAIALYLSLISAGGYYVRVYGGSWGKYGELVILAASAMFLLALIGSERLRANLKIFVTKNFFRYKYDYREEWLRFIRVLSRGGAGAHLPERAIQAIAQIVDASAGMMWLRTELGSYHLVTKWELPEIPIEEVPIGSSLVRFLEDWQWVINVDEYDSEPELYKELELPGWISAIPEAWLVVPLMQDVHLLGFIVVARPRVRRRINWEDHDLLKTAGRQAATHLAQMMATQALVEARDFFAFSRLSAFVMHDLKNVIGQLSLLVSNAAKFQDNPQFMADAVKTIEHSVIKMNRLLAQLSKGRTRDKVRVNLMGVLDEVVKARKAAKPLPELECTESELHVSADRDRLAAVIEHIVQNAQEATPMDGCVKVRLGRAGQRACLEIEDSGCGMDAKFIRDRLFRPFDTTKGQGGMGIGAFESREYVRELGGEINVKSDPGVGTLFRIYLPLMEGTESIGAMNEVNRG
jgi:putative PEP-CTERM system histidine kinase